MMPASPRPRWRSPQRQAPPTRSRAGGEARAATASSTSPRAAAACAGPSPGPATQAQQAAQKGTDQLIGAQLLTGLSERKPGQWQGKLFIPDKNMRVDGKIQLVGPQQLKVSGCVAGRAMCKSQLWTGRTSRFRQAIAVSVHAGAS